MTKSTRPSARSKDNRPDRPYVGFPLFPHATGQWAKKIRGRMVYFGKWDDPQAALEKFQREWPYLSEGRIPPTTSSDGTTLGALCNQFLTAKQNRLDSGELSRQSFADYHKSCDRLIEQFGKHRRVDELRPNDFEGFRKSLAKDLGVVTLRNEINRSRIVFKWAWDQRLIKEPVTFGQSFEKPSAKMLRKARNEAPPKMFTRDELVRILTAADVYIRAMVLLGLNGGLGNTDVANLTQNAINWETGWLTYPRPKTEIRRRIPLWPETITALQQAIDSRPTSRDATNNDLVFLTAQGNRWVRTEPSKSHPDRFVTVNSVAGRFRRTLEKLGINGSRGFYALRHVFETIAGESKDQVAVNAIMGHADHSMAAVYREGVSDARLRVVVQHVRTWLLGTEDAQ